MRRRKRKVGSTPEVELNMAAMLDMAFQLLAFFILTFSPSDVEIQLSMLMPPLKPVGSSTEQPLEPPPEQDEDFGFPIQVIVNAAADHSIQRIQIASFVFEGADAVSLLAGFEDRVAKVLSAPGFEGIELKVDPNLSYEYLIRIVDICTKQKLPDGQTMNKLSISQLQ